MEVLTERCSCSLAAKSSKMLKKCPVNIGRGEWGNWLGFYLELKFFMLKQICIFEAE